MKYERTAPCKNCPFRSDVKPFFTYARAVEITDSITHQQMTFPCHKTIDYDDDDGHETKEAQHCAGALILLEKIEQPNQMMRIAERLGMYDYKKLNMDAPVYEDVDEMLEAHYEADV